jgi:aminopeptidase N
VEFPYPGYTHVTVVDHHHGGMEHAGFSFVAPRYLAASEDGEWPLEHTESNYISHMLAHQWFGGIVNYRSLSHAWLNEGFAILLDSLWTSHTDSPHRFECKMWDTAQRVAASDTSEAGKPMVNRDLKDVGDIYLFDGSKVYYKGAWVLQMLRHQLGEQVFWRGVAKYLRDHRWQGVETGDLRRALEDVSGRDLEQFFRLWVYGHGVPRLSVHYQWDLQRKQARVLIRQTQRIDQSVPAFVFPLDLCFRVGGEDKNMTVNVTDARHEFTFDFPTEPALFCVDPRGGLLKTLAVEVPRSMLCQQAESGPTALARLNAVEELGKQSGPGTIKALEQVLGKESEFWMVRRAAAAALGRMQTEAALSALLRSDKAGITNPRVLAGLLQALGSYLVSPEAHAVVLKHIGGQKSLDVETAAVSALGRMRATPELVERSIKTLQTAAQKPTRRAVRVAALQALSALDDASSYDTIAKLAQPGHGDELRTQAIPILGRIGRHDGLRDKARETLTGWLYDPDHSAQEAAASGLGALGDLRSLSDLQRLTRSSRAESLKKTAGDAIRAIQHPIDAKQATTGLLERLTAIEKQNQELRQKVKELSEQLDSLKKPSKE